MPLRIQFVPGQIANLITTVTLQYGRPWSLPLALLQPLLVFFVLYSRNFTASPQMAEVEHINLSARRVGRHGIEFELEAEARLGKRAWNSVRGR
jgi:hypothetical protein